MNCDTARSCGKSTSANPHFTSQPLDLIFQLDISEGFYWFEIVAKPTIFVLAPHGSHSHHSSNLIREDHPVPVRLADSRLDASPVSRAATAGAFHGAPNGVFQVKGVKVEGMGTPDA